MVLWGILLTKTKEFNVPHFNDQYPSMEEIIQKRQEELEYENNALLKEQNELLKELLGKPKQIKPSKNKYSSDFSQECHNRKLRMMYFSDLINIDYNFED